MIMFKIRNKKGNQVPEGIERKGALRNWKELTSLSLKPIPTFGKKKKRVKNFSGAMFVEEASIIFKSFGYF